MKLSPLKLLKLFVFLSGVFHIIATLTVTLSRITYPYEIEWVEGASLSQVIHFIETGKMYSPPSLYYVSMVYTPIYYYFSAFFASFLGVSFTPLRLVSLLSCIATSILIYRVVFDETKQKEIAFLSVSIFFMSFPISGSFYDIGRPDMLSAFFAILATVFLKKNKINSVLFAGVLYSLAFFTKQPNIAFFIFAILYVLLFQRESFWLLLASFTFISIFLITLFATQNDGWFLYYSFKLPTNHRFNLSLGRFLEFLSDLIIPIMIGLCFSLYKWVKSPKKAYRDNTYRFYTLFMLCGIGVGLIGFIKIGGHRNAFVPGLGLFAITFGLGIQEVLQDVKTIQLLDRMKIALYAIWLLCLFQFMLIVYNPMNLIPSKESALSGDYLVSIIEKIDGDVIIPRQNYLGYIAGKKVYFNQMAMDEIQAEYGSQPMAEWSQIESELRDGIQSGQITTIILDKVIEDNYWNQVASCYTKETINYPNGNTFIPVAGSKSLPGYILHICPDNQGH